MSVLVIGDVMLDRYWYGDVSRLSQEAPVPVVKMEREECRAGAAANVAANCASLGADVTLIGIVGHDESAEILYDLSVRAGVNTILLPDHLIRTTQKLRVIGKGQQIVRVDFEQRPITSIDKVARKYIENHDVIVFSDYGKGALPGIQALIKEAKAMHKTVLVDPKGHDFTKYAGADVVKPNKDELREVAGGWGTDAELAEKVCAVRLAGRIGALLVTRAADGMTLYDYTGATHIPTKAVEVYDVTGAGDTVMAALAVMIDEGKTLREAATIANFAAGVVVGKFGTSIVTQQELKEAMRDRQEA